LNAAPVVVDEISIVGSRCGRFAPALELLARGAVETDALVHEEFPLSEGARALERAAAPGVLKVLIRP
jgi:threonine dehydrogenase-like Zn-dependent dehydrogenase